MGNNKAVLDNLSRERGGRMVAGPVVEAIGKSRAEWEGLTTASGAGRKVGLCASYVENTPPSATTSTKASVFQKVFHVVAFIQTFSVWFWHFTPAASYLPGRQLYGLFFRYLTFCTYTLQALYYACAVVCDFAGEERVGRRFHKATGMLAGLVFTMSNVVTFMYYGVMQQFSDPIEGSNVDRPPYLNISVHLINCVTSWIDLLTTKNMSLCGDTIKATWAYGLTYTAWMHFIKNHTGKYPYPFLDKIPPVLGPLLVVFTAFFTLQFIFIVGRKIREKIGLAVEGECLL
ncbi:hypothetical protein A3770_02p12450 [Chloropicon primus]|uniref:Uncharacterized protein n=1 Tax=Chloropicon primus TaxID=1764295 RepID=A0A5B8MEB7_9CHLO|nr:hypothetical protein A3770_02p12450 [Chloropicon primus]|eukprot:QDZ18727.1 hypothetical protein A3770_02p12450 [Chloropicon primus]